LLPITDHRLELKTEKITPPTMHVHLDWEWELEIEFNPQELGELYELHFFLGPVPSNTSHW
jgi:hypothetical protein